MNGNCSGNLLNQVNSWKFPPRYEFSITELCEQSGLTLLHQLEWSELVKYSGVLLELVNQGELGKKLEWKLTLKIPTRSFGAVIQTRNMLSSMNLEEVSRLATYYDGWTATQSWWKLKDQQSASRQTRSGSPRT